MNMEQRARIMQAIRKTEMLLDFAMKTGDRHETERLQGELARLVGQI